MIAPGFRIDDDSGIAKTKNQRDEKGLIYGYANALWCFCFCTKHLGSC